MATRILPRTDTNRCSVPNSRPDPKIITARTAVDLLVQVVHSLLAAVEAVPNEAVEVVISKIAVVDAVEGLEVAEVGFSVEGVVGRLAEEGAVVVKVALTDH